MSESIRIAEQLEHSPLFKGVELADREALIKLMRHQTFAADEVLFPKDSVGDSIYVIVSGQIRIFTEDTQGNEFTIRHLKAPNTFGELSMLDQKPRSASAAAAEPVEVLVLHRDDFEMFLRERPRVGLSMMRNLVDRVRYTTTYLRTVMETTQQLAEGNTQLEVDQAGTEDEEEIRQLLNTLVDMVQRVQEREESLKLQVGTQPGKPE
ncbi:MAG: cyclic nucleotide-binding domain-containing protein [Chloroflexi bacterium]|nr:cyclic nucleotide-binding domain-containing protein [Chloroflexota bacterium]